MDNLVFEESINTEVSTSEFVDKQWLYVNDNNNSSYSSQIVIDTTPLSNAGGYIGWSESFLAIPLVLQMESAAMASQDDVVSNYLMGLKNGYWNILHSLTCEFNNGNIIQQVPFLNVFCSFKALTSWANADVENWGAICGFAPDSARSWIFNNKAPTAAPQLNTMMPGGTGVCNNRISPVVDINTLSIFAGNSLGAVPGIPSGTVTTFAYNSETCAVKSSNDLYCWTNEGLKKRMDYINFSTKQNTGAALDQVTNNQAALLGTDKSGAEAVYNAIFQGYYQRAAGYRAVVFNAVVRLKDVADFFYKCPLLKGSTMRLYLNTNQVLLEGALTNAVQAADASGISARPGLALTAAPVMLGGGGTCPIMLASADVGQPLSALRNHAGGDLPQALGAASTFKAGLSIVRTQFSQLTNTITAPITSCRLYAPCYTMSPIAEQRYLSLSPTKKVMYNDIFQYSFDTITAGSTFNLLVTNGIPNIRSVLVVPLLAQAANGTTGTVPDSGAGFAAVTTNSLLSPFSTTGGTPDPLVLGNFNIQISGKNLFNNNQEYNFEQFYEQLVSSNQLNGSLTTSMGSGQISFEDFQSLYRYYYGNASRSIPSEDGVAKAVQLLGVNRSPVAISLMVFIEFEREITIDVRTGARVL